MPFWLFDDFVFAYQKEVFFSHVDIPVYEFHFANLMPCRYDEISMLWKQLYGYDLKCVKRFSGSEISFTFTVFTEMLHRIKHVLNVSCSRQCGGRVPVALSRPVSCCSFRGYIK